MILHPAPRAHQAAQAADLGPSTPVPPCLGRPLQPGPGGTCCSWHGPKPFGEVYFYQGRSRSWKPPRASPSLHTARGPEGETRQAKPTPSPRETFPEHSRPCTLCTEDPAPITGEAPPPPLPAPLSNLLPSATCPQSRECPGLREGMSGRRDPEALDSTHLPHGAWHQEGSQLVAEGTNDPAFWAEVQIWGVSRTHHGISAPEVQRNLRSPRPSNPQLAHLRWQGAHCSLAAPSIFGHLPEL